MSKARIFAILAFIALGAAWGSLIVGDATWFAWCASIGAVALIIWSRATSETADVNAGPWFEQIHPSPPHGPLWRNRIRTDDHRPVWPTDIFGAPE